MATIQIFAKMDHVALDGSVPLYLRLTINRKSHPLKLSRRVQPADWDPLTARVKQSHPNHEKLNQLLALYERRGEDVLLEHEIARRPITPASFFREFSGLSPYDFYHVADKYKESIRGRKLSWSYQEKIRHVVDKLKAFAPSLNLAQIDFEFVERYMAHLRAEKLNVENTVNSNIKILRRIFRHALKLKLAKENPFSEVRLVHVKTQRDSLTLTEYKQYEDLLEKGALATYTRKTLIWFLLACATGRRYEDLQSFYSWEFYPDYARIIQMKRISGRQERKVTMLFLNNRIRRLVDLIRSEQLPVITGSSRKFLKQINEILDVKKTITFHSGRHTFANINKELTSDITVRRDLLGHDSTKSTLIYDHVNERILKETMLKWNDI